MCTSSSTVIPVLSTLIALVAVFFGPLITARSAKRSMLGPMRQAWINNLRDTIAEFMAEVAIGGTQTSAQMSQDDSIRHAAEDARKEQARKTWQLKEKIHLLSNATEEDHIELCRLVDRAYNAFTAFQDTTEPLNLLRKWAQKVIKTEWDVVKEKGE